MNKLSFYLDRQRDLRYNRELDLLEEQYDNLLKNVESFEALYEELQDRCEKLVDENERLRTENELMVDAYKHLFEYVMDKLK